MPMPLNWLRRTPTVGPADVVAAVGSPIRLDPPAHSIGPDSYVRWESLGWRVDAAAAGEVIWWSMRNACLARSRRHIDPLARLVSRSEVDRWRCDIQEVVGLVASRAPLERYGNLDELALTRPDVSGEISEMQLQANLDYHEVRITKADSHDLFVRRMWDGGRVFLSNSGGSRHFAGARYVARRLGRAVPLEGRLITYAFDQKAAAELRQMYWLFAVHLLTLPAFGDVMERLKVGFGELPLPRPHEDVVGILLPREDAAASAVAKALAQSGQLDLGAWLARCAAATEEAGQSGE